MGEGGVSDAVHSKTRVDTCPTGSDIVENQTTWQGDVSGNGFIGQNMELGCYRIVMVAWGILIL